MKLALLPALALALVLAGCATPETRLRSGLQNAGLSKAMAACMAERMVDRLSPLQLRRPSAIGSLQEIGRASCRERVCQYGWISVVAVSIKKKQNIRAKVSI